MNSVEIKLTKCTKDTFIEVGYDYEYDEGVHTYPNGDPGYPPFERIDIQSIYTEACLLSILDVYSHSDLEEEIKEYISEYEQTT